MSKYLYSAFETWNNLTGKWEIANLYSKNKEGEYRLAQLLTGNSEYWDALFGSETFDFPFDDEGEAVDNLIDPIERISGMIENATYTNIPNNASDEATEYYANFITKIGEAIDKPDCVVYTLQELDMIELLARSASAKAVRFYNRYFAQVRWLLNVVMRMNYESNGSFVRVIIWGY